MYLWKFVFASRKSDVFHLCCVIEKYEEKNSGFIAATVYFCTVENTEGKSQ
jgi:hypothetical protein